MTDAIVEAVARALEEYDDGACGYRDLARAAIAALDAHREWRTIADAPKDGIPFLAIDSKGRIRSCCRHNPSSRTDEILAEGGGKFNPTHWMPLPAPPKEAP